MAAAWGYLHEPHPQGVSARGVPRTGVYPARGCTPHEGVPRTGVYPARGSTPHVCFKGDYNMLIQLPED